MDDENEWIDYCEWCGEELDEYGICPLCEQP